MKTYSSTKPVKPLTVTQPKHKDYPVDSEDSDWLEGEGYKPDPDTDECEACQ